jgi:signal transduction histidine kinase
VAWGFVSVLLDKTLRSSTLRLAITYVIVFCTAIFLLIVYVYLSTASYLYQKLDDAITAEQTRALKIYQRRGSEGLITFIDKRTSDDSFDDWIYLFVDPAATKLAGNLESWPSALWDRKGWSDVTSSELFTIPSGGQLTSLEFFAIPSGGHVFRASYQELPNQSRLLMGLNASDVHLVGAKITTSLVIGAAMFLTLATAAALSTARRSVGRIETINLTSHKIMHTGLGSRIPLRGTKDEWDELANNLNSMLGRIEKSTDSSRQVADSIAHDLRMPLARLYGKLESAQVELDGVDQYRALVNSTIGELNGILSTFSSLLRLSRIESGNQDLMLKCVDLSEIAREVVDLFEPMAEEAGVRLCSSDWQSTLVRGDRDLLFDAISNILDNAIKYGGNNGEVRVSVCCDYDGPTLSIADRGPGIPPEERDNVLKRFYRLKSTCSRPGSGLGLSLVAAIASVHQAAIELTDNVPGLNISLRFPDPGQQRYSEPLNNQNTATIINVPHSDKKVIFCALKSRVT